MHRHRRPTTALRVLPYLSLLALLLGTACSSQPPQQLAPASYAMTDTGHTFLGTAIERSSTDHDQKSGFRLLNNGLDAFAVRLLLMEAAEASIDVQTYLYHDDVTSQLFSHYLIRAADRGVRVRLLLDDFGHGGQEPLLASMASHPNVSVRLFNPFSSRTVPYLDMLTDFSEKSRRMHNKTFTVDNQAAIIGGRNIGDTYFAADPITGFADLDVLGVGPFARKISASFDTYWNHALAVPIATLWQEELPSLTATRQALTSSSESEKAQAYLARLTSLGIIDELRQQQLELHWARSDVVYDHPDKLLTDPDDDASHMAPELVKLLQDLDNEALIISPYFIPGDALVGRFADWRTQGARVLVLTNSLAANDVAAVHAGYAHYREALLEAGTELWELRPRPSLHEDRSSQPFGSSRASLHAKTMVFDRRKIFVGSMNLDPRSVNLNTEIGAVIDSSEMAGNAAEGFLKLLPDYAWRLQLVETSGLFGNRAELIWLDTGHSPPTVVSEGKEPEAGLWRRFQAWFIGLLPVESLL
ncbi:phospholipase D family protein [Marinobacter mobilis]|uniref:Phosphatidylserine/phosphatidylglycerophosphate/cardiolipin synthase n=1 Tax=Marinobacter mobilis TaxID=488533 RepID=A0A1H2SV59_9GAMM|nr:phospholipase D family protein [Marinobacter mobilis]SDW35417.1 Phosphatidylserine/phosphatidylglycerophosphate/cardiolipin synthase [Marinobacter mobilis]